MSSFDPSSDLPPSTLEELTFFRSVNPDWRVDLLPPKGGDRKLTESDLEAIATTEVVTVVETVVVTTTAALGN